MADHRNDVAGVVAPPPLIYGGGIAAGILGGALLPDVDLPGWMRFIGLVVVVLSSVPGLWAILVLLRAKTSPEPWHPTTALVEIGPYQYSRNPIYLSFTMFMGGLGLLLSNVYLLAAVVPVLILVHHGVILREERYLARKFGEQYEEYAERVRRWL